jgi:hypothetical protein
MVMQIESTAGRIPTRESATTRWERSLFSPSNAAICYCGEVVSDAYLCADCSERMSNALQRALLDRTAFAEIGD